MQDGEKGQGGVGHGGDLHVKLPWGAFPSVPRLPSTASPHPQLHFAPSCLTLRPETPDLGLVEINSLLAKCGASVVPVPAVFPSLFAAWP